MAMDKTNKLVVDDPIETNENRRVYVYYLGTETVEDITDEAALKAIDSNPVDAWGISEINKVKFTKAGKYVVLLYLNAPGGPKQTFAREFSVTTLEVDENNKVVVEEMDAEKELHRLVVYNIGDAEVDPSDETALRAIDTAAYNKAVWGISEINNIQLTSGNYVLHLYWSYPGGAKQTVALQVSIP